MNKQWADGFLKNLKIIRMSSRALFSGLLFVLIILGGGANAQEPQVLDCNDAACAGTSGIKNTVRPAGHIIERPSGLPSDSLPIDMVFSPSLQQFLVLWGGFGGGLYDESGQNVAPFNLSYPQALTLNAAGEPQVLDCNDAACAGTSGIKNTVRPAGHIIERPSGLPSDSLPIDMVFSPSLQQFLVLWGGFGGGIYDESGQNVAPFNLSYPKALTFPEPIVVNSYVDLKVIKGQYNPPAINPTPDAIGGTFLIISGFTNTSESDICNPFFEILEFTGGNRLLHVAVSEFPTGGGRIQGLDGMVLNHPPFILKAGELLEFDFLIGMQKKAPFRFFVNMRGFPQAPGASCPVLSR